MAVVALLIVVAVIGVTRLGALNEDTNLIVNDRVPKVTMVNTVTDELNKSARYIRNMMLMTDPAQIKVEATRWAESRKVIAETLPKLEKVLSDPKGVAIFKEITDARAKYLPLADRMQKHIDEGKQEDARKILYGEFRPVQVAYFDGLKKISDFQSELMIKAGKDSEDEYKLARIIMLAITGGAVLLALMIAFGVTRSITQPMAEAVKIAQTVAKGDLTSRIEVNSTDETGQLLQALKDMNESLVKIVGEVRHSTDAIATASAQIASGNMDLSSRTEEQASSLEETASSMEEMTSTVRQNADNANQANQLAISAADVAEKGGAVVSQVVRTMGSINDSSRKIVDIISVIDGIAFQTNILALNAAVEAARAGEQGRGFAVVATEVRSLAQRSAAAAREIKTLIDDSVEKVGEGSRLVEQAGTTMEEVVSSIKRVQDIMGEITAAGREQTDGIEQINQAVIQMDQVTQQNAALVEEAAAAAESLQDQASNLVQVVSVFNTGQGSSAPVARPVSRPAVRAATKSIAKAPAPRPAVKKTPAPQLENSASRRSADAQNGGDWEEF
jgi:methyl-accepting chemotaxis protein